MSFRTFGNTENDPGQWFEFGSDDAGKPVRFRIRAISPGRALQIEARFMGRKRSAGEGVDTERAVSTIVEKAVLALVASENCVVVLGDEEAVKVYTDVGTVAIGAEINLDERWTPALKAQFFRDQPEVRSWVLSKSSSLRREAAEDEGKG